MSCASPPSLAGPPELSSAHGLSILFGGIPVIIGGDFAQTLLANFAWLDLSSQSNTGRSINQHLA